MVLYPSRTCLSSNLIALMDEHPLEIPLLFFYAHSVTASALTLLTAACADLAQTFCANHECVLQKASFNRTSNVLLLRIAFSRLPLRLVLKLTQVHVTHRVAFFLVESPTYCDMLFVSLRIYAVHSRVS